MTAASTLRPKNWKPSTLRPERLTNCGPEKSERRPDCGHECWSNFVNLRIVNFQKLSKLKSSNFEAFTFETIKFWNFESRKFYQKLNDFQNFWNFQIFKIETRKIETRKIVLVTQFIRASFGQELDGDGVYLGRSTLCSNILRRWAIRWKLIPKLFALERKTKFRRETCLICITARYASIWPQNYED